MILAAGPTKDGVKRRLFVGLDDENMKRLRDDKPILQPLDQYGLPGWELVVLGPEDSARFVAHVVAGDIETGGA